MRQIGYSSHSLDRSETVPSQRARGSVKCVENDRWSAREERTGCTR